MMITTAIPLLFLDILRFLFLVEVVIFQFCEELKFWWWLHWVFTLLLVGWPPFIYWSYKSMNIDDLSMFWDLPFIFQCPIVLYMCGFSYSRNLILLGTILNIIVSWFFCQSVIVYRRTTSFFSYFCVQLLC